MTTRAAALPILLLLLALGAACGNWQRVGSNPGPSPEQEVTQIFDPAAMYSRIGRFVTTGQVSYVGSVAFAPGRGDSTLAIIGVSLANRSFSFERQANAFSARYRVEYQLDRVGAPSIVVGQDQAIRVGSFQETQRTDESILQQQQITIAPGAYQLTVRVRDLTSNEMGTATQRVAVPAFTAGTYTAPILAYRVRGRANRGDSLSIVLNPRGTLAYGGDTLLVYLEGVGYRSPTDVPLLVRDERDSTVLQSTIHFKGTGGIEGQVIRLAPDSAPLGQLTITLGADTLQHRASALVSFSNAWVVTNFNDLLALLRYFGDDQRVNQMRNAKNSDRTALWRDFYRATDPNLSTPENEALESYFARIAVANQRFRETGFPGWRTNRGEVFIVLGDPDQVYDQSAEVQNQGRIVVWVYPEYHLQLTFQDVSGFGRFQLTPTSRAEFDRIKVRVQARQREG